ncbi:hypothetical protein A2V49_02835 [candidate division WWE3 bacterium RBG_19FT_COMBO_34_6]|uniref:Phosphoglycerate mutase n=1 Tax=candidate division WWE3 bacterium RBG_19FT_COMBO_34_6 TaxID=1802612 RepID=A0A1F4UQH6_UNCKA|nr:MAG: hypothetical protein A2V49_02835 [candidate division WWE3 bacterium RBG_19FT_COMBO_34_6]
MIKTIYFVRHGHFQVPHPRPQIDETQQISLSVTGIEEILELAHKLKSLDPEIKNIFTSPYIRTMESAKLFSKVFGIEVVIRDDLMEDQLGEGEIKHLEEVFKRMKRCIDECLARDGNTIIISHRFPISLFINRQSGLKYEDIVKNKHKLTLLKTAECLKITYTDGKFTDQQKIT